MKKIIVLAIIVGFIVTACNIAKKKNVDYQKLAQENSNSEKSRFRHLCHSYFRYNRRFSYDFNGRFWNRMYCL